MDIAEFGQHIDNELGKQTGFTEALRAWRKASTLLARIDTGGPARAALITEIDKAMRRDTTVLRHNGKTITRNWVEEKTAPYFKSALVQAVEPELWAASRVTGLRLAHFKSAAERRPWEPVPLTTAQRHDLPGTFASMKILAGHARANEKTHGEIVKAVVAELHDRQLWEPASRYVLTDGWELEYSESVAFREWRLKQLLEAGQFDVDPSLITAQKVIRKAGFVYDVSDTNDVMDQFGEGDIDSDHWAE